MLQDAAVPEGQLRWPLGEIDRPFEMRRDPLVFDARSAAGNLLIHGGPKSGEVDGAADLHPVGGRPARSARRQLLLPGLRRRPTAEGRRPAHVGSVASPLEPERIRRTFGELETLLRSCQRGVADQYGHVFLVIDNLYAFSRDNIDQFNTRNPLLATVTELANTGHCLQGSTSS